MIADFLDPTSPLGFLSPNHLGNPFHYSHHTWPTIQHYYQFAKSFLKEDQAKIRAAKTPQEAHAIGQTVERKANWSKNKAQYLANAYWAKITQNQEYVQKLTAADDVFIAKCPLVPGRVWGVDNGVGENVLGLIVSRIRDLLIQHAKQQKYFHIVADQLATHVNANVAIKALANNSAIIGAFAESTVREFVRRNLLPLKVSTGGVVSYEMSGPNASVPQIDSMIWHSTPLPAIFESGEFALIDKNCCLGVLEVKRSMYAGVGYKLTKIIENEDSLTCWLDDWNLNQNNVLGVICLQEEGQVDSLVEALVDKQKAVVLLRQKGEKVDADRDGLFRLVNFLGRMRRRATANDGTNSVKIPDSNSTPVW